MSVIAPRGEVGRRRGKREEGETEITVGKMRRQREPRGGGGGSDRGANRWRQIGRETKEMSRQSRKRGK